MFERFTDRSRRAVVLAQEEARRLSHDWIGTEHLLLGLIREEEGIAAKALTVMGISLDDARRRVEEMTASGEQTAPGDVRFTPRAKTVLGGSLRESLRMGHNHIGTEHILLSLADERDGLASQILASAGAIPSEVRRQVIRLLAAGREPD